jgi:hypothetical protein
MFQNAVRRRNGLESSNDLEKACTIILVIFVSVLIAAYFVAMALGLTLFFSTPEGVALSRNPLSEMSEIFSNGPYVFLFTVVYVFIPVNPIIGPFFLFLWGIYLLCFVVAWRLRESLHKVIKNSLSRPLRCTLRNSLFAMPLITSMVFTAILLLDLFQRSIGIPTGEVPLPENPIAAFFAVSYAPVAEEIGFRIIPIGAFLIVYLILAGWGRAKMLGWGERLKVFLYAWLYPEKAKEKLGFKTAGNAGILRGISLSEWIVLILTSVVFGLAHYYGGGWEAGKITMTFIQGFAMGLAYLLYGAQAPILIHWYFNYYSWTYFLALEFYPATLPLIAVFGLVTFALGALGWIILVVNMLRPRIHPRRPPEEPVLSTFDFNEGS